MYGGVRSEENSGSRQIGWEERRQKMWACVCLYKYIDIHIKKYKEEPNSLGKNKICVEELKCSELKMGVNIA